MNKKRMDKLFCFDVSGQGKDKYYFWKESLSGGGDLYLLESNEPIAQQVVIRKEELEEGFELDQLFIKFTTCKPQDPSSFAEFSGDDSKVIFHVFPLYLYQGKMGQQAIGQASGKTHNLNPAIVQKLAEGLGLHFVPEKETESKVCFANSEELRLEFKLVFAPIDILDYVYGILHSPTYRENYREFLKRDFPRIPYPNNDLIFWKLVEAGRKIRQVHLQESRCSNRMSINEGKERD